MRVLVTGGCGFIGSAVVRHLINDTDHEVINVDKMTYAATEGSIAEVSDNERYRHLKIDICDGAAVEAAFLDHQPDAVMHLAAESHVDRSIEGPEWRHAYATTPSLIMSNSFSASLNSRQKVG